jgi:hypothetical protein
MLELVFSNEGAKAVAHWGGIAPASTSSVPGSVKSFLPRIDALR